MVNNRDRAARIDEILPIYPEDQHTNLIDLVSDVMHWCSLNGVDFDAILAKARMHFEAESEEGGA